jgi:hypothetical protein
MTSSIFFLRKQHVGNKSFGRTGTTKMIAIFSRALKLMTLERRPKPVIAIQY